MTAGRSLCCATTLNVCTPGAEREIARSETTAVLPGRPAASLHPDAPVVLPSSPTQPSPVSVTMLVRAAPCELAALIGELSK